MIKGPPNPIPKGVSYGRRILGVKDPEPKGTKWWLISDEDVEKIQNYLKEIPNYLNEIPSHLNEIPYMRIMVNRQEILHTLNSGLHKTDAIPSDYQEKEIEQIDQDKAAHAELRKQRKEWHRVHGKKYQSMIKRLNLEE